MRSPLVKALGEKMSASSPLHSAISSELTAPVKTLQIDWHDGWHGIGQLDAKSGEGTFNIIIHSH